MSPVRRPPDTPDGMGCFSCFGGGGGGGGRGLHSFTFQLNTSRVLTHKNTLHTLNTP